MIPVFAYVHWYTPDFYYRVLVACVRGHPTKQLDTHPQ